MWTIPLITCFHTGSGTPMKGIDPLMMVQQRQTRAQNLSLKNNGKMEKFIISTSWCHYWKSFTGWHWHAGKGYSYHFEMSEYPTDRVLDKTHFMINGTSSLKIVPIKPANEHSS